MRVQGEAMEAPAAESTLDSMITLKVLGPPETPVRMELSRATRERKSPFYGESSWKMQPSLLATSFR